MRRTGQYPISSKIWSCCILRKYFVSIVLFQLCILINLHCTAENNNNWFAQLIHGLDESKCSKHKNNVLNFILFWTSTFWKTNTPFDKSNTNYDIRILLWTLRYYYCANTIYLCSFPFLLLKLIIVYPCWLPNIDT